MFRAKYCPKHVELILQINKSLLHLVGSSILLYLVIQTSRDYFCLLRPSRMLDAFVCGCYRYFGTSCRFHLQRSRLSFRNKFYNVINYQFNKIFWPPPHKNKIWAFVTHVSPTHHTSEVTDFEVVLNQSLQSYFYSGCMYIILCVKIKY